MLSDRNLMHESDDAFCHFQFSIKPHWPGETIGLNAGCVEVGGTVSVFDSALGSHQAWHCHFVISRWTLKCTWVRWCLCNVECSTSFTWRTLVSCRVCGSRVILIEKIWFLQLLHGFKMFHFVPWFQNSFCFCSTTTPSAVRKFFGLQWEFQWENGQKSFFGNKIW